MWLVDDLDNYWNNMLVLTIHLQGYLLPIYFIWDYTMDK